MNKVQLIVTWVMASLVIIGMGLRLGLEALPDESGLRSLTLSLYDIQLLTYADDNPLNYLIALTARYKRQLFIGVLLVGGLLIYTLRTKKK